MNVEELSDIDLLKIHFIDSETPDEILIETESEIVRRWAARLPVVFVTLPDFSCT